MDIMKDIGQRLIRLREREDLPLEIVAAQSRVSAATISRIETGKVKPNRRTLYKILKAYPQLSKDAA